MTFNQFVVKNMKCESFAGILNQKRKPLVILTMFYNAIKDKEMKSQIRRRTEIIPKSLFPDLITVNVLMDILVRIAAMVHCVVKSTVRTEACANTLVIQT
ncbi:CLUMA_CG006507, isoform B [Clunio marinus]|uniref:CLUMA_CG006507, isoform B n=1 Tax=Clunio marinus TaxID=568069 RepID=A0A1J1HZS7_9DIPT|nr:CLUMA_CG006507, isoform B [Clunio marinus]